jgi:hypothetical protein
MCLFPKKYHVSVIRCCFNVLFFSQSNNRSFRSIITTWMDSYSEDFDEPPAYENLMMIMEYCLKNVPDNTDMVNYLNERLKSFVNRKKIKDQQTLNQINAEKQERFERIIKSKPPI